MIGRPTIIPCENGFAVVIVLLAMLLMSTLGVVLVLTTSAETRIAASFRGSEQALYAADAAAERSLDDLRDVADWNTLLDGSATSTFVDGPPSGTRTIDDGSTIDLMEVMNLANCQKKAACSVTDMNANTEDRPWGPNNPRWILFAYGPLRNLLSPGAIESAFYSVVMIGDDPGETDGDPAHDGAPGQPGAGVIALRAEVFGPGGAHKVVELTLAHGASATRVLSWRELR